MIAVLTVTQRAPSRVLLIGVAPTGLIVLKCFVTGAHAPAYYLSPLTELGSLHHDVELTLEIVPVRKSSSKLGFALT